MTVSQLLEKTKEKCEEYGFCVKHRTRIQDFSREGKKLNFAIILMYVLRLVKKSAMIEIIKFFRELGKDDAPATRNGVNEARAKIQHTAFVEIFELGAEAIKEMESAKTYNGYRLYAFDGSTMLLEKSDEIERYFGGSSSSADHTMARVSCVVDVLNGGIVDGAIGPYNVGERELAMQAIDRIGNIANSIYMFDRGYWSPELIDKMIGAKCKFLMRIPVNAKKLVTKSLENSGFFDIEYEGRTHTLRFYKFMLSSGELEILVTNLTHEEMPDGLLPELYTKRWGIETKYLELKIRLEIDRFSGKSVLFIKQDFFATLAISNIVAMFAHEHNLKLEEENKHKSLKNPQKTNIALGIGIFREYFIEIMLCPSDERNFLFDKLFNLISLSVSYERSDRLDHERDRFAIKNRRANRPKSVL